MTVSTRGERPMLRRAIGAAAAAMLLALGLATPVLADTIDIVGETTGQASTATIVCEFNAQTNTFTFTATNTSAITQPGSTSTITAFGFDLPPSGNASSSGLNGFTGNQAPTLSSNFVFSDGDLGSVPQFSGAVLDFGFITDASFATGDVDDGLLPGESASFTVSGAAFAGFTEDEICNAVLVRFENVGTGSGLDVGAPEAENPDNVLGISNPTLATAFVACSFNAQTNTLTFTILNTSPFDARITAIGFDLPPAGNASKSGLNGFTGAAVSQPDGTSFTFSDAALGKVPQVSGARLDYGFTTGKNFAGGKAQHGLAPGIDPGEEATFVVSGAAFAGLTEDEICDSIVVRFQGVGEDGTLGDVAIATPEDPTDPTVPPDQGDPTKVTSVLSGYVCGGTTIWRDLAQGDGQVKTVTITETLPIVEVRVKSDLSASLVSAVFSGNFLSSTVTISQGVTNYAWSVCQL